MTDEELREQAYQNVLTIRGSWDAPGFDCCVEAEYKELKAQQEGRSHD